MLWLLCLPFKLINEKRIAKNCLEKILYFTKIGSIEKSKKSQFKSNLHPINDKRIKLGGIIFSLVLAEWLWIRGVKLASFSRVNPSGQSHR